MTNNTTATKTNPSSKRVRIDTEPTPLNDRVSTSKCLEDHLELAFASLQHTTTKKFARDTCKEFVRLKNLETTQQNKLLRVSKQDYVPISARFKFDLKSNATVQKTDEFKALETSCKTAMETFQHSIKQNVIETVNLEIGQNKNNIEQLFCKSCHKLAQTLLLEKNPTVLSQKNARNLSLVCIQNNPTLLTYTGMTRTTFYPHFGTVIADPTITDNGPELNSQDQQELDALQLTDKLRLLLENIFQSAWKKLQKIHQFKETEKQLAALFIETPLEDMTDETNEEIGEQPTVEATSIISMVETAVKEKTKELNKKISALEQKLSRKTTAENTPGAPESARPNKSPGTTKRKLNMTANARKALAESRKKKATKAKPKGSPDGQDNDTSAKQTNKQKQRSGKPSPKKRNASTKHSKKGGSGK